jgi:hypothetical protein
MATVGGEEPVSLASGGSRPSQSALLRRAIGYRPPLFPAWAQSADRRNYEALQAKDRFEARLLAIIEARANKLLDVLAS